MARVTLVVNSADEGSETFLHTLADQLDSLGHSVAVHALLSGRTTMATGVGFDSTAAIGRSSALPAMSSARFVPALVRLSTEHGRTVLDSARRAVRRFGPTARAARAFALGAPIAATRPDVVHVAFSGIGVVLVDALELLDDATLVVVSCRGSGELVAPVLDDSVRPGLRRLLERADAVHAVADVVMAAAIRWGADPERIRVIRPAIDVDVFRRSVPARRPGPVLKVVTVARLHWIKAIDIQISAARTLLERGHEIHWEVVGDGPERSALEFRARALGVADHVSFLGACPPPLVREALESADVFVLSSLSEGTANSVLEAMALEVPVVSTAAGGMGEVLTDGVDSMVVPPGDPDSLVLALEEIIEQPSAAADMAGAARRTVVGGHTVQGQRDAWADFYSVLLGGRPVAEEA